MMHRSKRGSHLGYHTHYVVDGGKARIILQVLVTPSEVMENQPMLDLLWRSTFRWKIHPRRVTGDTTYGTLRNITAIEQAGIRAYVPLSDYDGRRPFFGKNDFLYDPERDAYVCPQGQLLRFANHLHTYRAARYQADAATCNACPLKSQCTTSSRGRTLRRSLDEAYFERVRAYHDTEPYKKALRKRKVWVEPLFAEAKEWHGMAKFRLRRLRKVNIEALLVAAGQNVKRLLAFGGRKPRNMAQAAALWPPIHSDHRGSRHRRRSTHLFQVVSQQAGAFRVVEYRKNKPAYWPRRWMVKLVQGAEAGQEVEFRAKPL